MKREARGPGRPRIHPEEEPTEELEDVEIEELWRGVFAAAKKPDPNIRTRFRDREQLTSD